MKRLINLATAAIMVLSVNAHAIDFPNSGYGQNMPSDNPHAITGPTLPKPAEQILFNMDSIEKRGELLAYYDGYEQTMQDLRRQGQTNRRNDEMNRRLYD